MVRVFEVEVAATVAVMVLHHEGAGYFFRSFKTCGHYDGYRMKCDACEEERIGCEVWPDDWLEAQLQKHHNVLQAALLALLMNEWAVTFQQAHKKLLMNAMRFDAELEPLERVLAQQYSKELDA